MRSPAHRQAWNILSHIPSGERTDAVCQCVCKNHDNIELLQGIRAVIREELKGVAIQQNNEQQKTGDIQEDVLGFLFALQEEGDMA